jgi:branched-chain amino acid transport system ATP-binding protein
MTLLEVHAVTKRFGGLAALSDISLSVQQGEIVGVVGPNGAGKSTLFSIIGGVQRPSSGSVEFAGHDVTGWPADRVAHAGIARTNQIMRPFQSMSVLDNVTVGALLRERSVSIARREAARCVELVGLSAKIDSRAGELSTGQRKRLELARAIATRPKLLLLDEVTAGVDQASIPGLISLVGRLHSGGLTVLVIEHNMQVVMSLAQRIVALHMGKKIAEGTPTEVVRNSRVIEAYLGPAYAAGAGTPPATNG